VVRLQVVARVHDTDRGEASAMAITTSRPHLDVDNALFIDGVFADHTENGEEKTCQAHDGIDDIHVK